jgi:hypothetical protein
MTYDLEYINTGMFTRFVPNTSAGEDAWRVMAASDGSGAMLSIHLDNVLRQIRKAGLSVGKAKPCKTSVDDILAKLEA